MIPTNGRILSSTWTRLQAALTMHVDCLTPQADARFPGRLGRRTHGGKARRGQKGFAVLSALFAFVISSTTLGAGAQTARVAGQVTQFGSSLTNAAGIDVDTAQNAYVVTTTGAVYKESFDSTSGSYTERFLFTAASAASSISVDNAGTNIYVGTGAGNTVVQYTGSGTSYTLGTTFTGFSGIASVTVDASGNVYIADAGAGTLYKETLSGRSFTQASIATGLTGVKYLTVDPGGTLFVADAVGGFQKISGSGTTYTKSTLTLAGYTTVTGLAVDAKDDLFISTGSTDVYEATLSGTTYTSSPYYQYSASGVALDSAGDVYVVGATQTAGTKLTVGSGYLNFGSVGPGTPPSMTVAFTLTSAAAATLTTPTVVTQGLTGYDFSLGTGSTCTGSTLTQGQSCTVVVQFSPQASGSRLGAVNLNTSTKTIGYSFLGGTGFTPVAVYQSVTLLGKIACPGSCGSALPNGLSNGRGITVDPAGDVWVANSTAGQILKFPAGSQTPVVFTTTNTCSPVGTAVDGEGNVFYTCNGESNIYELVGGKGTAVAIPISYGGTNYSTDDHLSVDAAGNLYPTSYQPASNLFFKVDAITHAVSLIATAPSGARFVGAVTDAAGNTFAPDYNNGILYELPAGASTLTTLYNMGNTTAPHAIAEDAAGSLYVTTTIPGTTGSGSSNLLRFSSGSYTSAPATISVPGGDSLWITPDGNFYTVYSNTTLAVYSRSVFALAFPNTAVGQASAAQSVTLENDGTAPLTISPPSSGTNPSISTNFSFDPSSTCSRLSSGSSPIVLAAGGSCSDVMEFTPTQAGSVSGSLVTTDNSANVAGSTQTINLSGTATVGTPTVTVPNASGTLGQNATLTATVSGGGVSPTGTVSFVVGSSPSVAGTCTSASGTESCTAFYSTGMLSAGANTITVSYAGDGNYAAQTGTGTLTLAAAPTTPTVTSSLNPSTFGAPVTFTVKVTSGVGTPSGSVTFLDGGVSIGTGTLDGTGTATMSTSTLSVNTHSITVSYTASGNFAASTSAVLRQTVAKATGYSNNLSTTNPSPSFGTGITLTDTLATLGGVAPTGNVVFYSNGRQIGTAPLDATGVAALPYSNLAVGSDTITALYGGDGSYSATSASLGENVSKATGYANTLTTTNASPMFGTSVTLTDTLPVLGGVAPTGTVTFLNGTTSIGTGTLANGVATLTTSTLPVGTDGITVSYNGDPNYNGSTSNNLNETVAKASGYTDVLVTSNATPTFGSSVMFTVTLGSAAGVYPTGTVTFLNGTTSLGTGTLSATGVAFINTSSLPVGSDSVTVQYNGDANFAAATSNAVAETVSKATVSSDVLTTSNANPAFGSSVVLTDTLAPINGVYPTGTVNFLNGTTSLGTGTISAAGVATLTTSALPVGADSITAQYAGDTNFNAITSNTLTETVIKATVASDVLSTSNATPGYGSSVTLTDTLAAVNGNYPTGTVTFMNGAVSLGTGTLSATGVATLTTTNLPVGTDSITAQYGGDTNFNTANSNTLTETVAKATGYSNVLTTSNATPTFGTGITLTDTIAPVNGTYPTGSVTFLNGTSPIGTGTLSATGVATLNISSLPVGTDTIKVSYNGDSTFDTSNSNTLTETVAKANVPSNVLTTSNSTPAYGASVTLTDTLGAIGGNYPSGTVNFFNGVNQIGSGTISATGIATFTTTSLPVGTDTITAQYAGDNNFSSSNSNSLGETVAKATGYSDVLTTSSATPTFGSNVTLTDTIAAVNATYPTGSVTFLNGTTSLGTGIISATGVATLTTNALPSGADSITAQYAGDNTFGSATSNAVTETVGKATLATDVLSTSNASPSYGTTITLTDTLPAVNGTYPTGTVLFLNGTTSIGSGILNGSGVATLNTSNLPVGTDNITAQFGGDGNFTAATSNVLPENVGKATGYNNILTSSNLNPSYGANVTLTDTFGSVNGVFPTGTVTFLNGTASVGTGTISASGVATLTTGTLPVGADSITAQYNGDTTFSGSTSNAVNETVAKADVTGDVLTTSNATPSFGGTVTLTDTFAAVSGVFPTGTVTFNSGTTALGTGTINASGVATLSTTALLPGTDTVTAVYGGSTTLNTATSNAITETVAKATGSNTLTTSNATPAFGTGVTFTATLGSVNGVTPTGTVTFLNGTAAIGTGTVNASGVATFSTASLPVGANSITASYGGDTSYAVTTSNAITETVAKASGYSDVLSASTTTPTFGQSVTLTDTLPSVNGVAPTGTVTFSNGTATLGTGTLNNGVATLTITTLPTGADSVTATYPGDVNFSNATSNTLTVTVGKVAATSNDTVTGSGTFGAATTPITVTIPYAGTVAPTGAITVTDTTRNNTITLQPATNCTASNNNLICTGNLNTANLPAGSNPVTVNQAGDTNFSGSTGTGSITLSKAGLTAGDTATGTGSYGAPTTPIAVTVPYSGPTAPTGAITVTDSLGNTVNFAASSCTASATALTCSTNLNTANEPVGANSATVSQGPDANYNGSTGTGTITIGKAPATTTDTVSGTGSYGADTSSVTVKIPFAGTKAPTGDITVADTYNNTLTIKAGSCTTAGQTLTCTGNLHTANEPLGSNALTVTQAGDSNYTGSTGSGSVTIGPAVASTGDTATGTGTYGSSATTVKVTIPYAGASAPTGAITLTDTHNNTVTIPASSCTAASGVLSCSTLLNTANEPVGGNLVQVSQAADADYAGSSGSGTVTISKAPASTNDSANGTGYYGSPTTAISITIPYSGVAAPTGAITVKDSIGNTVSIAASTCAASGYALACTANLPTADEPEGGTNALTVSQVGDGNYNGSTGTGNLIIGKARSTNTDTANGTGTYGDATTQVIVTIPYAGVAAPTGTITVSDSFGNKAYAQASTCVSSGGALTCTASLPTANEPTGSNPVTISQASDNNYAGSTGSGTVTINPAGTHGNNSATGSGSYGAPSTPITVVIPFSGATPPTGAITVSDALGNAVNIAAANCKASTNALVCAATLPTGNEPVGSNVVTVVQAADANYTNSTGSGAITINQAPVTTNDTATGTGNYGSATTAVTATIPYAGATAPSGAVTVTDSLGNTVSAPASACTAASQTLTCTLNLPTANEPLGTNQVTVAQAADANYAGSTGTGTVTIATSPVSPVGSTASGVQNVTITQGTTSTLLTATLAYGGAIPPSGAVTFTVAGGAPVTATCSLGASPETCTAMYPTDSLGIGTYPITATEAADANYTAGSATGTLTVAAGSVSPILDSISYVGNVLIIAGTQSATLTANITYTGPVPTGALTFNLPGGTPVTATCTSGPSPLACTATYPTASLAPATYVITALEVADSNYPQGEATALLTVSPSASTPVSPILATGSYVNSVLVPYGTASATLYATIVFNGPAPTGAVTFSVIGGSGASVPAVCTSGSSPMTCTADYPTANLGIGGYKIQVNVAADSNYPAGSAIGTLTISEVAASNNDAVIGTGNYGDPTTPITITVPYSGSLAPTGAITVTDSYTNTVTVQASVCTPSGGTLSCPATLPTANVPVGTDAATVSQGPDAVYMASTGKGSITIGKATATTTDTATGTGTFGTANTSVTVTIPYAGTTAPSGAVTISDSFNNTATIPGTSCTGASGVLTCTISLATPNEPLGTNPLTITQVGDTNYTGSTGTGTVTIKPAGATNGDTATGTGTYGAASTPVTIAIPYVGSTAPTGLITLTDTHNNTVTTPAAACTTTSTTITCNVNLPTATEPTGANTVSVSQAADSNFLGSTGTGTVTINKAPATSSDTTSGNGYYGGATTPVTVTIPYVGQVPPSGAITVTDTQNNTITVPASSCTAAAGVLTCTANLPTANEPVGTNNITVSQSADTNYSGSTGSSTITIGKAPVTTNDTATGTGVYGSPTTTVTVTIPYAGVQSPTGAITLTDTLGESVTVPASSCTAAAGVLTCSITFPSVNENVGNNPITVTQAGDSNYLGSNSSSTSSSSTITINKAGPGADTATGTGTYGAATTPVAVTIPFAGATPTGVITLADTHGNTITVTSCTAGSNTLACTVNLPTATEPVGPNTVTVSQAADPNHAASTGTGTVTINKAPATSTDTATGTGIYGAATTAVTVTIPYIGQTAPTGAVTVADSFSETATVGGSTCTAAAGTLTCTLNLPTVSEPVGSNPVTVTQVGDANYVGSTGSGNITVNKAGAGADTATGTGTYGAATTAVTVTIPYTGAVPTGSILLADTHSNGLTIAPNTCTAASGVLTCNVNLPTADEPVGPNALTISQPADANHSASTGTGTVTINKTPATSTDSVTGTGTYGDPSTQVTVTIPYIGQVAPTGAITISDALGNTVTVQASTCTAAAGLLTCTATLRTANEPLGTNQVTVTQAPDANYSGSTGTGSVTMNKPGTTTGDTVTGTTTYGSATAAVTISIPYIGNTAPTGAITLTDTHGNTVTVQASACTAAKGVLTCSATMPMANVPTGTDTITVNQAADALFNGSTGTGSVAVAKAAATTGDTVTGSGNFGDATTPVTVNIPYAGSVAPTGAITVADSNGNTVTVQASSCTAAKGVLTCTANLPTANDPIGTNTLTVTQAADANYSGSTGTGSVMIGKSKPTLTAPSISPMNSTFGTSVTITQNVPANETGTVTFYNGTTVLGTATIVNGVATLTTSTLPVGTDTITATANGDSNFAASTSPAVTDTIASTTTTVALTSSQSTMTVGTNVTFTATVSTPGAGTIAGTVTFYDGATALGTAPVNSGVATASTATLAVGTHAITATFTPATGSTLTAATSAAVSQVVTPTVSTITLTSSANPAIVTQSVTLTATVPASITGTAPTGKVTFYDGTTSIGTAQLNASGVATLPISTLTGGSHNITAVYAGDANYATVTSSVVAQKVSDYTIGNTTPTMSADPGAAAAFNITINPVGSISFSAPVVLTVTGLPAKYTAAFAQGTVTPGAAGTTTTMTVQTFAQALTAMEHEHHVKSFAAAAAWACLFPLLGLRRIRRRLPKSLLMLALVIGSFGVVAPLTGCGGGYFGPQPTSYTLTVTGTSGTLQRTTTVTLNVR